MPKLSLFVWIGHAAAALGRRQSDVTQQAHQECQLQNWRRETVLPLQAY